MLLSWRLFRQPITIRHLPASGITEGRLAVVVSCQALWAIWLMSIFVDSGLSSPHDRSAAKVPNLTFSSTQLSLSVLFQKVCTTDENPVFPPSCYFNDLPFLIWRGSNFVTCYRHYKRPLVPEVENDVLVISIISWDGTNTDR